MLDSIFTQPSKDNLLSLLILYTMAVVALLLLQWRGKRSVGLPLAYLMSYSMLHAVGAAIYSMPSYHPRSAILLQNHSSLDNTFWGFRVACFGFVMLVCGVALSSLMLKPRKPVAFLRHPNITTRLPVNLIIMGLIFFFGIYPLLGGVMSLSSLSIAGTTLTGVGVYLRCRLGWEQNDRQKFLSSLLMTLGFPLVTIMFMGFASYGSAMAATIWMLVFCFARPRWLTCLILMTLVYFGLSFYINWMVWRNDIRSVVWGSQSIERRVESMVQMVASFEFLDVAEQSHLEIMDLRLNQNDLVGKGVVRLESGRVDYGEGYSLWVAATSWIPRVLWPSKPQSGGSGSFVSHFTGQEFAEGTSVGAGQPLEFFANFGMSGCLLCFLVLGWVIGWIDCRAAECMNAGDWWSATRWLLPGLSFINPGGLMNESVSSAAAAVVLLLLLHYGLFRSLYVPMFSHRQAETPGPVGRRYSQ